MERKKADSQLYETLKNKKESDLTPKERRLLEKEKLSTMTIGGKLGYLWTYYKIWLLVLILAVGLGKFLWDIYDGSKNNPILYITVANAGMSDTTALSADFKEYLENDNKRDLVEVSSNLSFTSSQADEVTKGYSTQMEYASKAAFVTSLGSQTMDVLIGPVEMYEEYKDQDIFLDLRELLTQEQLEQATLTQDGLALTFQEQPAVIQDMGLEYEPVYVAVAANAPHREMVQTYLTYLLEQVK